MRTITITYKYSGDEDIWRKAIDAFITALNSDANVASKFTYQVAVADDGETRLHWGRWDTQETLAAMQSTEYFKSFSMAVKGFADGAPSATAANVMAKTEGW